MTNTETQKDIVTLQEAAKIFGKKPHNISYLIQYRDEINKYDELGVKITNKSTNSKRIYVSVTELTNYFAEFEKTKKESVDTLNIKNPELEFADLSDAERTKHVHILHPYLGKFIPQLAEHYLKKYFKSKQWILDPFAGSGTTLIEANVLGMNSVGIDISAFNCTIIKAKTTTYNLPKMHQEVLDILTKVSLFSVTHWDDPHAKKFLEEHTNHTFGGAKRKQKSLGEFLGQTPVEESEQLDFPNPEELIKTSSEYMKLWFARRTIAELRYYVSLIPNYQYKDLLMTIASRAARSARMVKHIDLARPKEPLKEGQEYICVKHKGRT
ncbi:MAG: DNA methyltransferase, partial [Candidatus Hodarchaeota archaeon]